MRLFICVLLLISPALPATKVFLRNVQSPIQPVSGTGNCCFKFLTMNNTQGAALATLVTTTSTGPVAAGPFPLGGGSITDTTGTGTRMLFISQPLSAGVTIAGTITPNIYCLESVATANAGFRYQVLRWDALSGGIANNLGLSANDGVAECGTTATLTTAPTMTPTSTVFNTGDRIVLVIYIDDATATTMAAGNMTIDYNAATGGDGDSYLSFTETITFAAESNNARSIPGN